jgi:hypothetical protein
LNVLASWNAANLNNNGNLNNNSVSNTNHVVSITTTGKTYEGNRLAEDKESAAIAKA